MLDARDIRERFAKVKAKADAEKKAMVHPPKTTVHVSNQAFELGGSSGEGIES